LLAIHFNEVNRIYKAPADWNDSVNGPCADLPVKRTDDFAISRWQPSYEELQTLNSGGAIEIAIAGGQPAIAVSAVEQQ
jgi:hypothetical protein